MNATRRTSDDPYRSRRTVRLLFAALAFAGLAVGTSGLVSAADVTPASADEAETSSGEVYQEYVTPAFVVLPGSLGDEDVTLLDDLTGRAIPFTGLGVEQVDGGTRVWLPQLPPGTFTVIHPTGSETLTVRAFDGSLGPALADGGSTSWLLYLVPAGALVLAVALRRRRGLAVLTVAVGVTFVLAGMMLTRTETGGDLGAQWKACEGANVGARDQLSCKVSALVTRLERGEYDQVRTAIAGSTDPSCHEVAHRSSYHIWRTTRDTERAREMLIPGCDDGLIHGISESMATFSTDEAFPGLLADFCSSSEEEFARGACFHGGGHAVIWRANGDLDRSFGICERFPDETDLAYNVVEECKGSAVMEWAERWSREQREGGETLRPRVDEPMELCLQGPASTMFRLGCYLGTNFRTGDAPAAAAWCNEREEFIVPCFEAIGENLPYFETPLTTIPLTLEKGLHHLTSCSLANGDDARDGCVRSTVRVYSVLRFSHEEGGQLCERVGERDVAACRAGVRDAEDRLAERGITLG